MKALFDRSARLKEEKQWHTFSANPHWQRMFINNRLFYSPKRHEIAYSLIQKWLSEVLKRFDLLSGLVLNSPCGGGRDFEMLRSLDLFQRMQIVGIDISQGALTPLQLKFAEISMICGDILNMPFKDKVFDLIITNLFLHHVVDEGLDQYINEFKRILRQGGYIIIQEPSILFPLAWITLSLRRLFYILIGHEVAGHVHHEKPFIPFRLVRVLKQTGFSEIDIEASSFVHNRLPLFVGKIIAAMQKYLYRTPILKYFAWNVIYLAKK